MVRKGESTATTGEQRYVALLRGVNVGGRNKLPMADLRDIFAEAGCAAVQTYIQSGNVVYEAAQDMAERVPEIVTLVIRKRFDIETAVIVRSREELRQVADSNPFDTSGDPRRPARGFSTRHSRRRIRDSFGPGSLATGRLCGAWAQRLSPLPQRRSPQQADQRVPCSATADREHHAKLTDCTYTARDGRRAVAGRENAPRPELGRPAMTQTIHTGSCGRV